MAVKKTHSAEVHGRLPSVKMWLEDIEEIGFWVQEVPSSKPVEIKVELAGSEYSLDRIADLKEIEDDTIDSINIKHGEGLLEVKFGSGGSSLRYIEGDPRVKASVRQISILARQNRRSRIIPWYHPADPGARWLSLLGLGVVSLTIGVLAATAGQSATPRWLMNTPVAIILLTVGTIVTPTVLWVAFAKFERSRLFTKTRANLPPFLQRRRDDLVITIASNLASLLIGGAIGYFVNKIS